MARYAFNTQNNSIKGITRYNLPADMHIHSFCFKLKILNNKKLKWPKFADKTKEMEFPGNMHIYTLCLDAYRVSLNSLQWFKRSCAYKLFITIFKIWLNFKLKRAEIPKK